MPYYLTPKQDDFNQELQICIAEALYDVDSIVADPGAYTKEQLIISLTAHASRSSDNSHLLSRFALSSRNETSDA